MSEQARADIGMAIKNSQSDSIREWQRIVHKNALAKGFYDCQTCGGCGVGVGITGCCGECAGTGIQIRGQIEKIGLQLLNMHAEISEASEVLRKNNNGFPLYQVYNEGFRNSDGKWVEIIDRKVGCPKPDGFAVELADEAIRLLDLCEWLGIDLAAAIAAKHAYNVKRSHRHGGKKY